MVEWAGKTLGCGLLGLNPLHALKNTKPYHISPYSPNSRLYLNELYLDIEQIAECHTSPEVRKRLDDPAFRAQLEAARKSEFVEYEAVAAAKRSVLAESGSGGHEEAIGRRNGRARSRGIPCGWYFRTVESTH